MIDLTKEALRARFVELYNESSAIRESSAPLRENRDKLLNDVAVQVDAIDEQIKTIEASLYDIEQEKALIARALGGQTGELE